MQFKDTVSLPTLPPKWHPAPGVQKRPHGSSWDLLSFACASWMQMNRAACAGFLNDINSFIKDRPKDNIHLQSEEGK